MIERPDPAAHAHVPIRHGRYPQWWAPALLLTLVLACSGESDWTPPAGAQDASRDWPLSWSIEPQGLTYAHLEAWQSNGVELRSCSHSFIGRMGQHAQATRVEWPRSLCEKNVDAAGVRGNADGTAIAFSSDSAVYIWSVKASSLTKLATDSVYATGAPAWSDDGMRLAFVGREPAGPGVLREGVYTVRTDGSDLRRITTLSSHERASAITWSPDGIAIAVAVSVDSSVQRIDRYAIMVIDQAVGVPRFLIAGEAPSWSPTGEWIAYLSSESAGTADSVKINAATASPVSLRLIRPDAVDAHAVSVDDAPPGTIVGPIVWRRDGKKLALGIRTDSGTVIRTATP